MINRKGNHGNSDRLHFFWLQNHCRWWHAAMKLKDTCTLEEKLWPTRQHIKKQRHYFADKCPSSQSCGFSSSHVWVWEFDYKESWALKNWWFCTVVLEKTLKSSLDCKKIKPFHPKGDQSRIFIGRTDAEAETPILWPHEAKNWLRGKDPEAGRLKAGGKGDDREWKCWMASLARWTWVWASSWSWWRTGKLWCAAVHGVAKSWIWMSD